jgi:hypothetical protein
MDSSDSEGAWRWSDLSKQGDLLMKVRNWKRTFALTQRPLMADVPSTS